MCRVEECFIDIGRVNIETARVAKWLVLIGDDGAMLAIGHSGINKINYVIHSS